jgi:hypothetical protein
VAAGLLRPHGICPACVAVVQAESATV